MLKVKYFSTAGDISDRERRNKVNPESLKCIENCENIAKKIKSILFDDGVIKSIRWAVFIGFYYYMISEFCFVRLYKNNEDAIPIKEEPTTKSPP